MKKVILIKYSEIALKGNNRHRYEKKLVENMSYALSIPRRNFLRRHGRIYIDDVSLRDVALANGIEKLKQTFGLAGFAFARAYERGLSLDEMKKIAHEIFSKLINYQKQTFRIQVRRINNRFSLNSMQIEKEVGAHILNAYPELTVNLTNPDLCLYIECRDEGIIFYTNQDNHTCYGGLPIATSGHGFLLLSGGIDSPVAGWQMMKRGMDIDAIHFYSPPFTGEKSKQKVIDLCQQLVKWKQLPLNLYIPHFTNVQVAIKKYCPEAYWTIIQRRFMLRIAERLAKKLSDDKKKYRAFITGDSLSQVASQTIENIAVIQRATLFPIFRPLIGFNKLEITNIAKMIGTFEISKQPYADCCTLFASHSPATKAWEDQIQKAEAKLSIDALVTESSENKSIFQFEPHQFKQLK